MRGSHLKLAFLATLLLIASSCLMHGTEGRAVQPSEEKPVQCERAIDCVPRCHGCTVNQCTAGLCVCGCAGEAVQPSEEKPVQCERAIDCVPRCHGCTVNQCTAGLCVCGCAGEAARKVPDTVFN